MCAVVAGKDANECRLLGKHRDLQRITVPYARILGVMEEDGE